MKMLSFLLPLFFASSMIFADAHMISHDDLQEYFFHGNTFKGLATPALGSTEFEVWRTSMAVGSSTPLHKHETDEIFIYLQGKGKAVLDGQEIDFEAPCTLILPANIEHQLFNTGDQPTVAIVIMGADSKIYNQNEEEMRLPWRK